MRRPRKRAQTRFADPPWDEQSEEWQGRDQQVSADHPAREVVEAMKQLDLSPLFGLYLGAGKPPIRPDLMLAIVLIEMRSGRPRPNQWFADTKENLVLQWAGFGIRPSRGSWYDATYVTACNLALCDQAGTVLYGPWQENDFSQERRKQNAGSRRLGKEHFAWMPEQNMYRCPEGHPMPWIGRQNRRQSDGQINVVHSYRCSPQRCRVCPRQVECSSNPNRGQAVKRSAHEALVEAHRARMATPEAKSLYRLRGQTVELGFADFKEHRAMRQFSGRGRRRAQRQVGLTTLVHNLLIIYRAEPLPETSMAATLTTEEIAT